MEVFKGLSLLYNIENIISAHKIQKGYANTNYKINTSKNSFLLKIHQDKSLKEIQDEIQLLVYLRTKSYPTAYPILNKSGQYISQLDKHWIVLYDFINGNEPDLNKEVNAEIAKYLSQLHAYPSNLFYKKYPFRFEKCKNLISKFSTSPYQYPSIFKYYEQETERLSEVFLLDLPIGLIHGDVFPDNTLFLNNQLTAFIDFERFGVDTFLIDLGLAANGFCFRNNELDTKLLDALISNYHKNRTLDKLEQEVLPFFIRASAYMIIYWHLNRILTQTIPKSYNRIQYLMKRNRLLIGS